jgi:hypothetical protein
MFVFVTSTWLEFIIVILQKSAAEVFLLLASLLSRLSGSLSRRRVAAAVPYETSKGEKRILPPKGCSARSAGARRHFDRRRPASEPNPKLDGLQSGRPYDITWFLNAEIVSTLQRLLSALGGEPLKR